MRVVSDIVLRELYLIVGRIKSKIRQAGFLLQEVGAFLILALIV